MEKQHSNNIRLGAFVIAGLLALIGSCYLIGENQNIFGSGLEIKVHFSQSNGLRPGNNVLYEGILAGNVKKIEMINDSTIEVSLLINDNVKGFIHQNAIATIGSEGLMGDKVVNLSPVRGSSSLVVKGTLLEAQRKIDVDQMLLRLSATNNNVGVISEVLKKSVLRLDTSAIVRFLNSPELAVHLRSSFDNLDQASQNANMLTRGLKNITTNTKNGKGALGLLLTDSTFEADLKVTMAKIKLASDHAAQSSAQLDILLNQINQDVDTGDGTIHLLLKDSVAADNFKATLLNLRNGTEGFNQNMEALKHNFFFKGYFKKQEKEKAAAQKAQQQQ